MHVGLNLIFKEKADTTKTWHSDKLAGGAIKAVTRVTRRRRVHLAAAGGAAL
jgi:hypothetical protein